MKPKIRTVVSPVLGRCWILRYRESRHLGIMNFLGRDLPEVLEFLRLEYKSGMVYLP